MKRIKEFFTYRNLECAFVIGSTFFTLGLTISLLWHHYIVLALLCSILTTIQINLMIIRGEMYNLSGRLYETNSTLTEMHFKTIAPLLALLSDALKNSDKLPENKGEIDTRE